MAIELISIFMDAGMQDGIVLIAFIIVSLYKLYKMKVNCMSLFCAIVTF